VRYEGGGFAGQRLPGRRVFGRNGLLGGGALCRLGGGVVSQCGECPVRGECYGPGTAQLACLEGVQQPFEPPGSTWPGGSRVLFLPRGKRPGSGAASARSVASAGSGAASARSAASAGARLWERVNGHSPVSVRAFCPDARGDMNQCRTVRGDRLKVDAQAIPLAKRQGAQGARHGPGK
jgi:hypothetical protein